jgi:hypothetical protein
MLSTRRHPERIAAKSKTPPILRVVILSGAPKVRSRRTRTNEIRAPFALRSKARSSIFEMSNTANFKKMNLTVGAVLIAVILTLNVVKGKDLLFFSPWHETDLKALQSE